jgi:hypothetical protein
MTGLLIIGTSTLLLAGSTLAQMQTPSRRVAGDQSMDRFGGGGPMLVGARLDLKELETVLPGLKFGGDFTVPESQVYLLAGGGGAGGRGHMLYGGQGWAGEWTVPYDDPTNDFNRATLSIEGGGFMLEHVLAARSRVVASLGGLIGGGELRLRLFRKVADGPWADIVASAKHLELSRSYWMVEPFIALRVRLFTWLGLRLSAGYLYQMSLADWQLPDETQARGGPLRTLGAPVIGVQLYFGL